MGKEHGSKHFSSFQNVQQDTNPTRMFPHCKMENEPNTFSLTILTLQGILQPLPIKFQQQLAPSQCQVSFP